jgi:PAS domain S-box-containing protein
MTSTKKCAQLCKNRETILRACRVRCVIFATTTELHMHPTNRHPWKGTGENDTSQTSPDDSLRLQAQMLDHIGQAVLATNLTGRITYANRAACTLYRWPFGEIIGAHVLEVMTPMEPGETTDDIIGCIERAQVWNGEFIVRRHDGTTFPAALTNAPFFDSTGKVVGLIGVSTDISERKDGEDQLRRQKAMLSSAARIAKLGSWEFDAILDRVDFSDEALEIFGLTREQFGGKFVDILKYVHRDDVKIVMQAHDAAVQKGGTITTEFRIERPDGTERVVQTRGEATYVNDVPVRMSGMVMDITERKHNERQWAVLSRLGRALNSARSPHEAARLMVDAAGELFGWDAANVQHYNATNDLLTSILTIDTIVGVKTTYKPGVTWTPSPRTRRVLKEGPLLLLRGENDKPDASTQMFGDTSQVSRSIMMVPMRNGAEVIGSMSIQSYSVDAYSKADLDMFQIFADYGAGALNRITAEEQRHGAEQRLAEQAALLDIAHDAILARDLEDRIIYWNKGAERSFGWTAQEMLGKKCLDFHKDRAKFSEALTCVMKGGEWSGEMPQITKDGRNLVMQVRWTLVRDSEGKPKGILAINTDITEKKKLEAQILRSQRIESIGTLAGGIAHDLNNVLAPILMAVHMLRETTDSPRHHQILDTLQKSSQRGADLVRQVLTFARGVEGKRAAVNVRLVTGDLQKVIHDTFPKNIRFKLECDDDLWTIEADPTQIEQVLMNLCVNARDALASGGTMGVHLHNVIVDDAYARMNPDGKPGPYVVVTVEDNGCGMAPDVMDKIFDPFFTTKDIGKGTGLGLATVLTIVKSHHGFINVYSETGKGSRFKVYLPASPSEAIEAKVASDQNQLPRGNGELIMIVDDEESIRHITQETLECFGYRTLQANNGAQAVALYAQHRAAISVVITDMTMPVMDGAAAITALRSINPNIRIIASSGLGSCDGAGKAAMAGVHYFVPKPYTAERLLKVLRKVLSA